MKSLLPERPGSLEHLRVGELPRAAVPFRTGVSSLVARQQC
jgi:hypothetical protein